MEEIRSFQETVVFAPFRPEFSRRWPNKDIDRLQEVEIRFRILPVFLPDPDHVGKIVDDLHFYLGSNDLTKSALAVLRRKLDDGDVAARRAQFHAAVDRMVPFWRTTGAGRIDVNAELAAAQSFLSATPLSGALPQFGMIRRNAGGMFGIWCFVFNEVDIEALRLSEILNEFNSTSGTALSIADLSHLDLALSPGPSPFRGGTLTDPSGRFGILDLSFESVYRVGSP